MFLSGHSRKTLKPGSCRRAEVTFTVLVRDIDACEDFIDFRTVSGHGSRWKRCRSKALSELYQYRPDTLQAAAEVLEAGQVPVQRQLQQD